MPNAAANALKRLINPTGTGGDAFKPPIDRTSSSNNTAPAVTNVAVRPETTKGQKWELIGFRGEQQLTAPAPTFTHARTQARTNERTHPGSCVRTNVHTTGLEYRKVCPSVRTRARTRVRT
jgi:hypothetical protein